VESTSGPHTTVGIVDGDNVIVRQSWLNQWPLVLLTAVLEVAIVYVSIIFPELATFSVHLGALALSGSYLPAIPVFVLLKAAFNIYNERLVITPLYLIHVTGRISWRERSSRLEYDHIQEIETIESIIQRILGLGDLNILPIGAGNRQAILMQGLRHPRAVKDLVRSVRDNSSSMPDSVLGSRPQGASHSTNP
jgi:uncharacterized membrane protein YdbT with pleckstrin-like domain